MDFDPYHAAKALALGRTPVWIVRAGSLDIATAALALVRSHVCIGSVFRVPGC